MNFIQRVLAKTPTRNKVVGQICTLIGLVSAIVLSSGVVKNEYVQLLFTILSVVFGGNALYQAQKVENG
jgi:hypothetical protein